MLVVTLPANQLNTLLENILLYTDKKDVNLREVLFVFNGFDLQAFSSDSYVTVTDKTSGASDGKNQGIEFALSIEDVEEFLEYVKKDKKVVHKSEIKLKFKSTLFTAEDNDFEGHFQANYLKPSWDKWDIVLDLLSEEQHLMPMASYSVNPERFAKLARLKADKEAPIALRGIDVGGKLCLQFKKGSTIVGAVMPIDESYVQEEFLWKKNQGDIEVSPNLTSTESVQSNTV
jgi:hypothetical protein